MGLNSMTGYQLNESSKGRRNFNKMRMLKNLHFWLFCLIHRLIATTDLRGIDDTLDKLVHSLDRLTSVIESKFPNQLETRVQSLEEKLAALAPNEDSRNEEIFFSISTSKRIQCFNCIVTFDTVFTMSSEDLFEAHPKAIFVAPKRGIYYFQFHALAEPGHPVKAQLVVNDKPKAFVYDRDVSGGNNRFAMVGQSLMVPLEVGDRFYVLLYEGALKGGDISHTFTSLNGLLVASLTNRNEL